MKVRMKDLGVELDKFSARYSAMKHKQVTELKKESASEMAETMRNWRQ